MKPPIVWYLAGPMSGIPQFNFPAFIAAAETLRKHYYRIVTPVELDDPETRERMLASPDGKPQVGDHSWGEYLARDVKVVADDVEGIMFMPGWEKSRGARLEAFVGLLCKHQFALYYPPTRYLLADVQELSPFTVMEIIDGSMSNELTY